MSRKRRCLLKGSSILVSPAILSSLSSQNVNAGFLGVNWEYIFSFFPYFRNYIFSFFSSYYAKEMAAYNLLEKVKKIFLENFIFYDSQSREHTRSEFIRARDSEGGYMDLFINEAGKCKISLVIDGHSFPVQIVREIVDGVPKLKFYNPFGDSFYIEGEEDLEKVKNFVSLLRNIAFPDIRKLCSFGFDSCFYAPMMEHTEREFVLKKLARDFAPEVILHNKKYKVSKLAYDIPSSEILIYSEDYNSGNEPIRLGREKLDDICKDILNQNKQFEFNLLQKAKEEFENKFEGVELKYNKHREMFEGKIKVSGLEIPIRLWVGLVEGTYVCHFYIYKQERELISFVSFDEDAEKMISGFINSFEYFLSKAETLKESGNLKEVDKFRGETSDGSLKIFDTYLHHNYFELYTKSDVPCTFTGKNGRKKEKTFRRMSYVPSSGHLNLYSYTNGDEPFHTYDFGKKEDREEFDKIVDTLVNNKTLSCFFPFPSFCKFKNNYWS